MLSTEDHINAPVSYFPGDYFDGNGGVPIPRIHDM